jgi:LmbE family N-acetylglucosaminyl deacetylase
MYTDLCINDNERLLIIAPHPDDETIGCGGILSMYGKQCDVLLLTDGRKGIPEGSKLSQDETAMIRKEEFVGVMNYFNVHAYQMLQIPDTELSYHSREVSKIDLREYDWVFVPNRNERHIDHKTAYVIVKRMCRKQKVKAELVEYEVWSPVISANCFMDISNVMMKKTDALRMYASQTSSIDYESLVKGLNMYRGAPRHISYCEAFYREKGSNNAISRVISKLIPKKLHKFFCGSKSTTN